MAQKMMQAYQQAPWRLQIQRLGTFLLVVIGVILIAGMYLFISAQAATAGLNIQADEFYRERLMREIASLKTQLGALNSMAAMEERAQKAGYKPAPADKGMYVTVSGYTGQPQVNLAPPPGPDMLPQAKLKPEYTQSLWEWLFTVANGLRPATGEKLP